MTIYSWNMLYKNRVLDRAFEFIRDANFDVFCLQEVPGAFLDMLGSLPCHKTVCRERNLHVRGADVPNYLVILSKHPIEAEGRVPTDEYEMPLPLRSRIFIRFMPSFYFSTRDTGGVFADIRLPGMEQTSRVFNLHLPLARPAWRLKEFETAMAKCDPAHPAIVCGDFNVIESLHVAPLNWLLGGTVSEAVRYRRERTRIDRRFVEHQLANALAGSITHPFSRSQLDHILVSHSFSIKSAFVLSDRYGSDHYPIRAEIE